MKQTIIIICIGLIALAAFLFFFGNNVAEAPAEPIAETDQPTDNLTEGTDYIGLTTAQAEARAEAEGELFRVVEIDGQPQPTTRDYRPGRINATVQNDVVTSYSVEGMETEPTEPTTPTPTNNDAIIGMTTAEAEAYAETNDVMFRIGAIDGEFLPVTMDYRPGRITAEVENDIVVGYSVE